MAIAKARTAEPILHNDAKRRAALMVNLSTSDLEGYVQKARAAIDQQVKLPEGYRVEFGGQFHQLEAARARLTIVVPAALLLIFVLVYAALGSVKEAAIVYTGIPFAVTGGVLALWLRGMPFSITAAIGFIALSGIAMLNGLVLIDHINSLRDGRTLDEAVRQGAQDRLRPVLSTALVASIGFLPMAVASGAGAEVQRPLATVVIGGILTSTMLTLLLLPSLYRVVARRGGIAARARLRDATTCGSARCSASEGRAGHGSIMREGQIYDQNQPDRAIDRDEALLELLQRLRRADYSFVAPNRTTHLEGRLRRMLRRPDSLRDIFGWNRAFRKRDIEPAMLKWIGWAGILRRLPLGLFRSSLRVSSLGRDLVLHSPVSTRREAVFFGPDSYRFARFLEDNAAMLPTGARVVDLGAGAGAGAGALALASVRRDLRLVLVDINREAVRLAQINLAAAGIEADVIEGDGLSAVQGKIDAVIANPPFLAGAIRGRYRNGGGELGSAVTLDWMRQSASRLGSDGTILLYGVSAIVEGHDALGQTLERELSCGGYPVHYRELDPDIFGGMLWRPSYRGVDRIAAVTMIATRLG